MKQAKNKKNKPCLQQDTQQNQPSGTGGRVSCVLFFLQKSRRLLFVTREGNFVLTKWFPKVSEPNETWVGRRGKRVYSDFCDCHRLLLFIWRGYIPCQYAPYRLWKKKRHPKNFKCLPLINDSKLFSKCDFELSNWQQTTSTLGTFLLIFLKRWAKVPPLMAPKTRNHFTPE